MNNYQGLLTAGSQLTNAILQTGTLWSNRRRFEEQLQENQRQRDFDLYLNNLNIDAQKAINQANIELTQNENAIMRQREDTAVQRRAADLAGAGINPLLAGTQGAAAAPGAIATMSAPVVDTSIGARYAANNNAAYSSYGDSVNQAANRAQEIAIKNQEFMISMMDTVDKMANSRQQREEGRARVKNLEAEHSRILADTRVKVTHIQEQIESIFKSKVEREKLRHEIDFITESIFTEPIKRGLILAQTEHELEEVFHTASKIDLNNQQLINAIHDGALKLKELDLSEQQLKKIGLEINILENEKKISDFKESIKEITGSIEAAGQITDIITGILGTGIGKIVQGVFKGLFKGNGKSTGGYKLRQP